MIELPFVQVVDRAHSMEHSLEVHLPFLQEVLGPFKLVPMVVGDAKPEQMIAFNEIRFHIIILLS